MTNSPDKVCDDSINNAVGQGKLLLQQGPKENGAGATVLHAGDQVNGRPRMMHRQWLLPQHTADDRRFSQGAVPWLMIIEHNTGCSHHDHGKPLRSEYSPLTDDDTPQHCCGHSDSSKLIPWGAIF